MNPPGKNVEALFEAALALKSDDQRSAYLDQACPEAALRREVEALLEAHRNPDSLFGEETVIDSAPRSEGPPTHIRGYQLLQQLGAGGMGVVYEAEHLESGRRVALKVLNHQLHSPDDRARFLREGRLAASINHPNSVYVFGTDEIDGTPVISMELIAGGTLQERVKREGPLPVGAAVDAILQVIAGLEAAQAIGILHRDIKPANCFEDADGTVKIGDFGLSISTVACDEADVTRPGTFLGTPAYCSPEQLRGEELNVRADLYAVGVTLFYLLTARTPFEGKNMVQLLANVLEQPAPSPKKFSKSIPQTLADVIQRCLAKTAGERFNNYDELRQALAPFRSDAPVPAPPGLRFAAGVLDRIPQIGMGMSASVLLGTIVRYELPSGHYQSREFLAMATVLLVLLLYYSIPEGLWGWSVGKAIGRLRVVGPDRNPPGVAKAFVRAALFLILPPLPMWIAFGLHPASFDGRGGASKPVIWLCYYGVVALLFGTARRRNGFAAIHDRLTGTRVIRKPAVQARPVLPADEETVPAAETMAKVGPYHVIERIEQRTDGEWLLGYDTRLLRKVWIRTMSPGAPPLAPNLRRIGRVGRLRWITGRRSPGENWDAFEGATGKSLVSLLKQSQPWGQVRFWLLDLANELSVAQKDGTLPAVLALDRVWITTDGRAKLLDFPAPGAGRLVETELPEAPPSFDRSAEARLFLNQVAGAALKGHVEESAATMKNAVNAPLPLHAQEFLDKLPALPGTDAIVAALKPLMQHVVTVSPLRRAGLVAACAAFPLVVGMGLMLGIRLVDKWQRGQPEITQLAQVLNQRAARNQPWFKDQPGPDDRTVAIYIASHFRSVISNPAEWTTVYATTTIAGQNRKFAEQSVAEHPNPTEQEITAATAAVKPRLTSEDLSRILGNPWLPLALFGASFLVFVSVPSLLAGLLFRGGLVLRVLGVAVVRNDGARASRLRVCWRNFVAMSPIAFSPVLLVILVPLLGVGLSGLILVAVVVALAVCSVAMPERSLQDRIAGTCLVPR